MLIPVFSWMATTTGAVSSRYGESHEHAA